jgi:dipeptidyl aminopeptidase/acylaminoacyl peptidase
MLDFKRAFPLILIAAASPGALAQDQAAARSPLAVADAAIDVTELVEFAVAPDGRAVAYVTATAQPEGAAYAIAIWVGDSSPGGRRRKLVDLPESPTTYVQPSPRFSPDGKQLAYLSQNEVHLVDLATGKARSSLKGTLPDGATATDFAWSPSGAEMALVVAMPQPVEEETAGGKEMTVVWPYWGGDTGPGRRLAIFDMASGRTEFLTGDELDVAEMSWSPDGGRLVLAASPSASTDRFYDRDIYILDRRSRKTTAVVKLDGVDSQPKWSPGGGSIAFASQRGEGSKNWRQLLGLYDVKTGAISYPARSQFEAGLGTPRDFAWESEQRLFFISDHRLHAPIFELDLASAQVRRFSPLDHVVLSGAVVSPANRAILFGCESFDKPRELCMSSTARFASKPLSDLNPRLTLPPHTLEIISWKSEDLRWDLEGVLIRPRGVALPLPLITLIEGGPSMVRLHFGLVQQYPVHALVAGGYAVFVPNTRGRGGYSRAFAQALPDSKDFVGGAFGDMMSGIDKLVRDGVADPETLGVGGFSYGAVLTAFGITQTMRFEAASINDGPVDFPETMALGAANPGMQQHWQDQAGFSDPYDPQDLARMKAQSPIYHIANARTPSLLEYGHKDHGGVGEMMGGKLFQGLRRFGVPSEFILYPRTGHGIYEPRLRKESARRNLEWFDYWLLGRTTERMSKKYGPRK